MKTCYICDLKYKGVHITYCKLATIRAIIEDGFTFNQIKTLFPIDKKLNHKIISLYKNCHLGRI